MEIRIDEVEAIRIIEEERWRIGNGNVKTGLGRRDQKHSLRRNWENRRKREIN